MKSQLTELRRLLHHYGASIYHGANGSLAQLAPTAYRALRARLKYGIGPIPFSILRLADIPESQWNGYILDNEVFKRSLRELSPRIMHRIAYNKGLFYEHCLSVGLPTIPIVCLVGQTPDPLGESIQQVRDAHHFESILASAEEARLFLKPIDGTHAEGAFLAFRDGECYEFEDRIGTARDLYSHIVDALSEQTGFVVQPHLRPNSEIKGLASKNGLPTVRVITAMHAARPELLFACLKIPVGASIREMLIYSGCRAPR